MQEFTNCFRIASVFQSSRSCGSSRDDSSAVCQAAVQGDDLTVKLIAVLMIEEKAELSRSVIQSHSHGVRVPQNSCSVFVMLYLNSLVAFDLQAKSIGGKSLDKTILKQFVLLLISQVPQKPKQKKKFFCVKNPVCIADGGGWKGQRDGSRY